jgi:hypothetical protein
MTNIERNYSLAKSRLQSVFPDTERGATQYDVNTRLEGRFAVSRLVHSRTGHSVGHVQWENDSGNIRSMNIDPEHRMAGFNFGRLLKGSWKDSEMLGIAGPVHGTLEERGNDMRNRITEFNPGAQNPAGISRVVDSLYSPGEQEVTYDPAYTRARSTRTTASEAEMELRDVGSVLSTANERVRRANNSRSLIERNIRDQDIPVRTSMGEHQERMQRALNRIATYGVDATPSTPTIHVEDLDRARRFSTEIGREPTVIPTGTRGVSCRVCNDATTHLLVGKVPLLESAMAGPVSEEERVQKSVEWASNSPISMTISSNLIGARRGGNSGEFGHPLGHKAVTVVPANVSTHSTIFASKDGDSPSRSVLIRIPVPCSCQ